MTCACCREDISPLNAWKGQSDHFYCSEFCAEIETIELPPVEGQTPTRSRA